MWVSEEGNDESPRTLCVHCFREAIADLEMLPRGRTENVDPWLEANE
jgi:hypothetical protein